MSVSPLEVLQTIAGQLCYSLDQFGESIVHLYRDGHQEYHAVNSSAFKAWLRLRFYESEGQTIGKDTLNGFLELMDARARFSGHRLDIHIRSAWADGAVYIDATNPDWGAFKIAPDGWEWTSSPPVAFRRVAHQKPIPEPKGMDIEEARATAKELENLFPNCLDWLLAEVRAIGSLLPGIPWPIGIYVGPPGSTKTTLAGYLNSIIDPSSTDILSLKTEDEIQMQLAHRHSLVYDNQDDLRPGQSDLLSRAVTGEGGAKRKLYTDDDERLFSYRRRVCLTGINIAARKGDLLERSIFICLKKPSETEQRTDAEMRAILEELRPRITGAFYTILAEAMKLKPGVKLSRLPRMADFMEWGEAISRALGNPPNAFATAYWESIGQQNDEAIEAHPVGAALLHVCENSTEEPIFKGTATQLLEKLNEAADELRISTKNNKLWPGGPSWVGRRLNEVGANLAEAGYIAIRARDGDRIITITRRTDSNHDSKTAFPDSNQTIASDSMTALTAFTTPLSRLPQDQLIPTIEGRLDDHLSRGEAKGTASGVLMSEAVCIVEDLFGGDEDRAEKYLRAIPSGGWRFTLGIDDEFRRI